MADITSLTTGVVEPKTPEEAHLRASSQHPKLEVVCIGCGYVWTQRKFSDEHAVMRFVQTCSRCGI